MDRRPGTPILPAAVAAALCAATPPLAACPVCYSDTGRAVRAGIVDDERVALNVAAIAAPFGVVAGVVLVVRFGPPRRRRQRPPAETRGPS